MTEATQKEKILVHTCCAPCASYVIGELEKEGYEIIGFFYNPEVHGLSEYKRRLNDLQVFCQTKEIELIVPEYDVSEFFTRLLPFQDKRSIKYINDKQRYRRRRCYECVSLLLGGLVKKAKELEINNVTTTMLCSPFRSHDEIWNTGVELAAKSKIDFFYKDFRKGYWNGRNYARTHKMSVSKYCGCAESLEEGLLE